jgi:hypothetical protein
VHAHDQSAVVAKDLAMSRARPLRNQTEILTEILTIYGEVESVVARSMAGEYGLSKIETRDFPPSVPLMDNFGRSAKFAIVMPAKHLIEFHERCARLRA